MGIGNKRQAYPAVTEDGWSQATLAPAPRSAAMLVDGSIEAICRHAAASQLGRDSAEIGVSNKALPLSTKRPDDRPWFNADHL